MAMRRVFFLVLLGIFASVAVSGCSGKSSKEGEKVPPAPSAREVVKKYTETLAGAPKSARKAADAMEESGRRTEKAIKELE
ncbi:MAG: hypothetical protein ACE5EI_04580 [Thermodesulfobacteriota bacterium]